ncbi:hypothetical protein C8T65DRAFT_302635 [Cerioporus squamosus]|nr:hypothetical protein C8T65DRAFT_302635 [Cerioporus squamosus]
MRDVLTSSPRPSLYSHLCNLLLSSQYFARPLTNHTSPQPPPLLNNNCNHYGTSTSASPCVSRCTHFSLFQGAIVSAIGGAINAIVSAIANIIMIIVSVIVTVRTVELLGFVVHGSYLGRQIIVTIFDVIFDIICCNCFGGRTRRTGTHRYRFGGGGSTY